MNPNEIKKLILTALREDRSDRDITSRLLVPAGHTSTGAIIVEEDAVLCGLGIAKMVFQALDRNIRFKASFKDGDKVKRNTKIATLKGKTRALLAGERTALNFLGHLCGIATNTERYVRKVRGTKAKILDTRKTTPGLRVLQKYAVRCGGGINHRTDLSQMALIKDNHISASGTRWDPARAVNRIRKNTRKKIGLEADNLKQFKQALSANPDFILLDNMTPAQMSAAVRSLKGVPRAKRPLLEASGGITLANVARVAGTGVDRISIGALTHTLQSVTVTMEISR